MPVIRIPDPVFERLQSLATPFVDTPATVIERLLDHYDASGPSREPSCRAAAAIATTTVHPEPDTPPDLYHTRVLSALVDGEKARNWNEVVVVAHRQALKRLKSLEALGSVTRTNIVVGRRSDSGYHFQPELNASVQYVDANDAWRNALHIARKVGLRIRVTFEWREKKGAARPGEQGTLEWAPSRVEAQS